MNITGSVAFVAMMKSASIVVRDIPGKNPPQVVFT